MFRRMLQTDILAVAAIELQVQSHPWSNKQLTESLLAGQVCTVLEQHGEIVGFCILQPVLDEANLLLMAIAPSHQGQGFGTQLLQQSLDLLNSCMMVFLEVRVSNTPAIKLYEKLGFSATGIRKNYYPAAALSQKIEGVQKEDALLMALTLGNPFA